ncbi:MAG: class I SAM-dependent methyltransferase [Oscillospiraceae bacterium]|jgi:O-methyltransferase involved in polyketide biosynthesis|nr:class I SAM-dependent methyltransferase [Oscillospiraceae bacterium]
MDNNIGLQEQTVQSTMLLPLYGRAKASRMFPHLMRDEEAIRIVDGMDYDFTQIDKNYATEYVSLCCLFRAKMLEERCLAYLREHPGGTVVNLGSGLDTTLSRIDDDTVRWYNLDLPDAVAFRHRFIAPPERGGDIARSMLDYAWLDEVEAAADGSVFILAGGLFHYFEESRLRELFARIAEHFPRGELYFDAQPKTALKVSNRMVRKTGNKGSEMFFYVSNAQKLKDWSPNIRKVETVRFFSDALKGTRLKLSTRFNTWGLDKLKMSFFVSIQW